jgi:hypothetical protein
VSDSHGATTTTFRDLALALSEEDRRSLLRKIQGSLSLKQTDDRVVEREGVADEDRKAVISREIDTMSLWRRIRFFFRRLFSPKGEEQTYIDFRLAELRRRARSTYPGLSPMEHHSVSCSIAEEVWKLYKVAYPVIPVFLDLWRGGTYLQGSIEHLLAQKIPGARTDLYDFVTLEEMQDAYLENEMKSDVREIVVERLELYLADIPDELLAKLEEGLLPFYYLKSVSLFDYNDLFSVFGFDPGLVPPDETPPFRDAPTSAAIPGVERLYHALHAASRLPEDFYVHVETLERYFQLKEHDGGEGEPEVRTEELVIDRADEADGAEEPSETGPNFFHIQEVRKALKELRDAATNLLDRVPFADMIRYYTRDPWTKVIGYVPKVRLREFYTSYLTIRLLTQLDERFGEVRKGVVERMTQELFGGIPPAFEYYRTGVQSAPEKHSLPSLAFMKSLAVAYNFLRFIYRGRMQEMVRILSRVLPVRQRDSSSDLVVHVAGVEQVLADLEEFDESFSPDSEDGKAFYRVRYGVEKDPTLVRSYRNMVNQRDREAQTLLGSSIEHLRGLNRVFGNIQRGLTDQLRERYAAADHRVNALDGLDRLLESYREKLDRFDRLIRQVRATEEGY